MDDHARQSREQGEPRIFWFRDFSRLCGEENFPLPPPAAELACSSARGGGTRRGRRRLGRGGKMGASEDMIAVEFEQPIHRLQIALQHHRMRNDPHLADAGDLSITLNM